MTNTLNKLTDAFLKGIAYYAYGCICYNQMGMSSKESDRFLQSLRASTAAAESAKNRAPTLKQRPIALGTHAPHEGKELTMQHSFPKQAFLDDLLARNAANLELVQTTFAPLDRAARSAQPEPDEWCVDQCMQHLVLSCEMQLTYLEPMLKRDAGLNSAESFTRSWLASCTSTRRSGRWQRINNLHPPGSGGLEQVTA